MQTSLRRIGQQIKASKAFVGPDLRLVVLPEYFLTSFPMRESIAEWREKACIEIDGPVYEQLGRVANKSNVFLSGDGRVGAQLIPNTDLICFTGSVATIGDWLKTN